MSQLDKAVVGPLFQKDMNRYEGLVDKSSLYD